MARIYICFVWHMHQPFYKDLVSNQYKLPWTRMHALKDYYGMVRALEPFPDIHQTFNLVPSMMVQVEDYAAGAAVDPFLQAALKPAEDLSPDEQTFILQYFFQANPSRMIYRYPRYGELYDAWLASERNPRRALLHFGPQAIRDLQVLSQLAWVDEEFQEHDGELAALLRKERNYSVVDQRLLGRKQREICGKVIPVYRDFAARGQIEISTTPFYHPILPLLCDSNIAEVSHPHVPLPQRFSYPGDARHQMERAQRYMTAELGATPVGLWPSEGSVSDEVFSIAADLGFKWIATDNGVLARTIGHAGTHETYRPYVWRQNGREIHAIFRDHFLSDLIGFVYSRMEAREAAGHFLARIRENCAGILASGLDALVPVILDGENAWEYYDRNGRPFLSALYRGISDDPEMEALTVSEALKRVAPQPIGHIFPGSWINANFDIWIGHEEDNKAWDYLLRARQTYDRVVSQPGAVSEDRRNLAYEELLISEGSDWCWWYGPQHDSANRPEFDQLFRDHLANVYRALNLLPPEELSRPILKIAACEFHSPPASPVRATVDGEVTSYFEWMGAGLYHVDNRSGAMHGHRYLIRELHYGSDGKNLFLRLDLEEGNEANHGSMEARLRIIPAHDGHIESSMIVQFGDGSAKPLEVHFQGAKEPAVTAEFAYRKILEMRLSLEAIGIGRGQSLRLQLSLWKGGLPMDALPPQGWIEISTAEPTDWPV